MRKPVLAAILAVSALLLTGCGTSPVPHPTFGSDSQAVDIARAVPACRAASAQTVTSDETGVTSVATCLITGTQVNFFVWKDADAQSANGPDSAAAQAAATESYVAHGDGWDATVQAPNRIGQQQLVATTVVDAVGGAVVHIGG